MRGVVAVASVLLLSLAASGCFVEEDDPETQEDAGSAAPSKTATGPAKPGTGSKTPAAGAATGSLPQLLNVSTNLTGLAADFTITAQDADNDTLTYSIAFGDNKSANGTLAPQANATAGTVGATVSHTYEVAGAFNVTVTVSDGTSSDNRTFSVVTGAAGALQEPLHLEGTVECLPTVVRNGELAGGLHEFEVLPGQGSMLITFTYDDGEFNDLDYTATDAAGDGHEAAEAGPEPPMTIDGPAAGAWTIDVIGYSCLLDLDYTIDITFA